MKHIPGKTSATRYSTTTGYPSIATSRARHRWTRCWTPLGRLSAGFPLVRVDLYEIAGQPVFGEMTFSPASGMDTTYGPEFQREMGDWISLPPAKRTQPSHPGLLGAPRTAEGRRK